MLFTVVVDDGDEVEFECEDTFVSRWVCQTILEGTTYPALPFVDDVQVVFDVGANCGAASVHFARHHPEAAVHAFEPASRPLELLRRNAARYPNIEVHPFGLHTTDQRAPLWFGSGDSIVGSVVRVDEAGGSEEVELRAAGPWAAAHGIDRIDVLKLDVEGAEVEVLESLAPLLPTVKVLFVEYDSRQARQRVAELVEPSHELYVGILFLDQGEATYLRRDLADHPGAREHLLERWRALTTAGPGA
ncbi:MAG: FkbM family methyltransferase [Acidimicrobiia bacterium]|jgi:FkbM family methyltransferase